MHFKADVEMLTLLTLLGLSSPSGVEGSLVFFSNRARKAEVAAEDSFGADSSAVLSLIGVEAGDMLETTGATAVESGAAVWESSAAPGEAVPASLMSLADILLNLSPPTYAPSS